MPTHAERRHHSLSARTVVRPGRRCRACIRSSCPGASAPACAAAPSTELVADLTIGFGPFRESFASRVTLDRPHRMRVRYENGPFRYLNNTWDFLPHPARHRGRFLRRFRIPQPHPAGRDRRGVQRGGAAHGERVPQARARGLRPAAGAGDRRGTKARAREDIARAFC